MFTTCHFEKSFSDCDPFQSNVLIKLTNITVKKVFYSFILYFYVTNSREGRNLMTNSTY